MTSEGSSVARCASCGTRNRVPWATKGIPRCANCKASLPWIGEAGDDTFASVVAGSVLPVLVDVWAPWCGPCRAVSPALEHLAGEFAGRIKLVKVNADDAPGISTRFEVRAIPTLLVMLGDEVVSRQTGAAPEPQLRSWLEGALATLPTSSS